MSLFNTPTIQVKPKRLDSDALVYGSEEVRQFIRESLHSLAKTPYDHETGALPIRTDAFFWAAEYLCGKVRGIMYPGPANFPTVSLLKDGTVSIRFVEDFRSLTLFVLAKRVVTTLQTFDDGQTRIERMLPGVPEFDQHELEYLFDWLFQDAEIAKP